MPAVSSWVPWALASAVFAALTAVFAKVGVEGVSPDLATWLRTLIAAAVLGAVVALTGAWQDPRELPRRTLVFLTFSALATGASWLCYFRALQAGDAARVAPVDKLSVVLVAVFAVLFLGERLAPLDWVGVALVTAGAVLLAWPR